MCGGSSFGCVGKVGVKGRRDETRWMGRWVESKVSCGRVGSSHARKPAFGQGAEYPMKLLQQSCAKLKLHTQLTPCTTK